MRCDFLRLVTVLLTVLSATNGFGADAEKPPPPCAKAFGSFVPPPPAVFALNGIQPGRANDPAFAHHPAVPYDIVVQTHPTSEVPAAIVNGILITKHGSLGLGAFSPLPAWLLRAEAAKPSAAWQPYHGKKVLLLGEGLDERVRSAAASGVEVRSMDLWYEPRLIESLRELLDKGFPTTAEAEAFQAMVEYYEHHQKWLVPGSVFDIPYADGSFAAVMSRKLLNNIRTEDDQLRALREMCRVVAVGGAVTIENSELFKGTLPRLQEALGDRIRVDEGKIVRLK